jgi:hypothetical protein
MRGRIWRAKTNADRHKAKLNALKARLAEAKAAKKGRADEEEKS